jgi:ADP-ribosyl-[dinitrogen reductase] hydrolase
MNQIILGAMIGDAVGSIYEFNNIKTKEFEFFNKRMDFTDDSVMTMAVALWLATDRRHSHEHLVRCMRRLGREYPDAGYGGRFNQWLISDDMGPYNSWGNGSAMRVSPVGCAFDNMDDVLRVAKISAEVTHDHPEGIKGAQATAAAIFLARQQHTKEYIRKYIADHFGYDLSRSCDEIRPSYKFNESCQHTVPEAIAAFLESTDYEDAIRLAISLGGDSDTLACITGGIASAFYGELESGFTDDGILSFFSPRLNPEFISIFDEFEKTVDADMTERDGLVRYLKCYQVLQMVAVMHSRGYQKIRIMPTKSASGCYWRCSISVKQLMSKQNGAMYVGNCGDERTVANYTSGNGWHYFQWEDGEDLNPEKMADRFLREYPYIAENGRGEDAEYAAWFRQVLDHAGRGHFPVAEEEYFSSTAAGFIRCGKYEIPLPSAGEL